MEVDHKRMNEPSTPITVGPTSEHFQRGYAEGFRRLNLEELSSGSNLAPPGNRTLVGFVDDSVVVPQPHLISNPPHLDGAVNTHSMLNIDNKHFQKQIHYSLNVKRLSYLFRVSTTCTCHH